MSKKTKYVPPAAELILLAPCEKLAAWDWKFGNIWQNTGYYTAGEIGNASAIVVTSGFLDEDYTEDSGFFIKK